jgi:hypothetical protein
VAEAFSVDVEKFKIIKPAIKVSLLRYLG